MHKPTCKIIESLRVIVQLPAAVSGWVADRPSANAVPKRLPGRHGHAITFLHPNPANWKLQVKPEC